MIFNMKPRMYGRFEYEIHALRINLELGESISILCSKKDEKLIKRYQDRFKDLGIETIATEMSYTKRTAVYDNDPFEPVIIGFKYEKKFTGYKLVKK